MPPRHEQDTPVPEDLPLLFLVATVTPFDARGRLDLPRLRAHVLWLAARGVEGFVPTAFTGELPYLTDRERAAVHRTVLDAARGLPVYPCVWDTSPSTMGFLCDAVRDHGASGVLVPPPLHYPLEQGLLADWFRSVADTAEQPVLALHAPEHAPTDLPEGLYLSLRDEGVLAGLVDATGDRWRLERLAAADPGAVYAAGDTVLPAVPGLPRLAGHVSALGNAWPELCLRAFRGESQLREALRDRDLQVRRAGGFRALKGLLEMGCRVPFPAPPEEVLAALPPREGP